MPDPRELPGAVTADDAEVRLALEVWETSNPTERRELASGLFEAVTAYRRTGNVDHLVAFADSVAVTVQLRRIPEYVNAVRNAPASRPEESVDVHETLKELGLRE